MSILLHKCALSMEINSSSNAVFVYTQWSLKGHVSQARDNPNTNNDFQTSKVRVSSMKFNLKAQDLCMDVFRSTGINRVIECKDTQTKIIKLSVSKRKQAKDINL